MGKRASDREREREREIEREMERERERLRDRERERGGERLRERTSKEHDIAQERKRRFFLYSTHVRQLDSEHISRPIAFGNIHAISLPHSNASIRRP